MIYLEALSIYLAIGCFFSICYITWEFVHAGPKRVVSNRALLHDVERSFIYALLAVAVVALLCFDWVLRMIR